MASQNLRPSESGLRISHDCEASPHQADSDSGTPWPETWTDSDWWKIWASAAELKRLFHCGHLVCPDGSTPCSCRVRYGMNGESIGAGTIRQVLNGEIDMTMRTEKPSDIFRERLRVVRDGLRGMSQAELAKITGLPPSSIAHFEGGTRKPSFDNLRKLATALNVTTDYLLGRVDAPEVAASADPLYRRVADLTERDRSLAADFLDMLAERDRKARGDEQ